MAFALAGFVLCDQPFFANAACGEATAPSRPLSFWQARSGDEGSGGSAGFFDIVRIAMHQHDGEGAIKQEDDLACDCFRLRDLCLGQSA